jgi:hypothetical protein
MKMKHLWFWLVIILLLGSTICFGADKKIDYSKHGVCVVADASIRAEASKNGKWLSSLAMGETVILQGNPVKDSKDPNTQYIKVKLSDGTQGFVNAWCLVPGAFVAVIQKQAKIYKRPDLLADTNTNFEMMNIVAIDTEKGDWIRATGENKAKSGWVDKNAIRKAKEDIITAVMLRKALRGKENTMTREELEKIVAGLPYPTNYFAVKMLQKYKTSEPTEPAEVPVTDNTTTAGPTPAAAQ